MDQFFKRVRDRLKRIHLLRFAYNYIFFIQKGKRVYQSLIQCVGTDTQLCLLPCNGSGDAFIVCSRIESYFKKKKTPFLLISINQNIKEIGKLFQIKSVYTIMEQDMNRLLSFVRYYGLENLGNVKIMHFDPPYSYTHITAELAGYKGMLFRQMYVSDVFDGMPWDMAASPQISEKVREEVEALFVRKKLIEGKTVLLLPYTNTLPQCSRKEWEVFVQGLLAAGFCVCTNTALEEQTIPGTRSVFFSYEMLLASVDRMGYVVGIRSGIFDMIASCRCKKYILYPEAEQSSESRPLVPDFYSVRDIDLCQNTKEYFFSQECSAQIFQDILSDLRST